VSTLPVPSPEVADAMQLRQVFRTFATGVTVVTVGGASPHGMTANSFTSVSLDPPLVLVCVGRDTRMHHSLTTADSFGVSVLAAHQELVGKHFASRKRGHGVTEFDPAGWTPGRLTGVPLLVGALATFECRVWGIFDGGDHTIFTGRLMSMNRQPAGDALLFYDGRFRQLNVVPAEATA
jgi:flavin reductase